MFKSLRRARLKLIFDALRIRCAPAALNVDARVSLAGSLEALATVPLIDRSCSNYNENG